MIIPDLNLLLYAYNPRAADHAPAKRWWEELLRSGTPVAIPWIIVLGFVRLSTTRGVFGTPATPSDALERVESWFLQPSVSVLNPGARHLSILHTTLANTAGGSLTTDAHLAALAIEHHAELHSNDGDFSRFPGLRWQNPIAPKP
jgi:toxin-antitoxin system PIN domain toxin